MTIWTPIMDARLLGLIDGGASYSKAGAVLGVNRNQVSGRLFRLSGKHKHYSRPTKQVAA